MFQCEGKTKSGTRCKRTGFERRCYQHQVETTRPILVDLTLDVIETTPVTYNKRKSESVNNSKSNSNSNSKSNSNSNSNVTMKRETRTMRKKRIEDRVLSLSRQRLGFNLDELYEVVLMEEQVAAEQMAVRMEEAQRQARVREPPRRPRKPVRRCSKSQERKAGKNEDCCVCMDEKVYESELLKCSHAVCMGCVKQLRDPRCPMCRSQIEGDFISDNDKKKMNQRAKQDKRERNEQALRNYLIEAQSEHIIFQQIF
jgi:hypothetical protein